MESTGTHRLCEGGEVYEFVPLSPLCDSHTLLEAVARTIVVRLSGFVRIVVNRPYSLHRTHGETGLVANRGIWWAKGESLRLGLRKDYW